jgi:hypothetical protein
MHGERNCRETNLDKTDSQPAPSGLNSTQAVLTHLQQPAGEILRGIMKLLNFLVESFVGAFGITRPKPEQQRTVALVLGGFLLLFFPAMISLIVWMLFGQQR